MNANYDKSMFTDDNQFSNSTHVRIHRKFIHAPPQKKPAFILISIKLFFGKRIIVLNVNEKKVYVRSIATMVCCCCCCCRLQQHRIIMQFVLNVKLERTRSSVQTKCHFQIICKTSKFYIAFGGQWWRR